MSVYLIGYDLRNPQGTTRDYKILHRAIEALGEYWHCLYSTWIIKTDDSADAIRDFLEPVIEANDSLLVVKLAGDTSLTGFDSDFTTWLNKSLKQ
jgi:hypothetical protein